MKKNHSCILQKTVQLIVFIAFFVVLGCGKHAYYKVEKGDTLYSIGWQYQVDYRTIASWNGIQVPYVIHEGDWIRITPAGQSSKVLLASSASSGQNISKKKPKRPSIVKSKPAKKSLTYPKKATNRHVINKKDTWKWPVRGPLLYTFTQEGSHKQGIGISGTKGQSVSSAKGGRVVYSGRGLVGYGNLIIIKHNEVYLSAYAHNERNLVKEGQRISQGMKIAYLGDSGAHRPLLHFEIRKNGKAVNPLIYLPRIK